MLTKLIIFTLIAVIPLKLLGAITLPWWFVLAPHALILLLLAFIAYHLNSWHG